jgi:hypothetical protein
MTWSYVGLAAAAVSETATRVPALRPRPGQGMMVFGITVAVATLLVVVAGARLIRRRRSALLAPYRPATRGSGGH